MSRGKPRLKNQTARGILERCKNMSNTEGAIIIEDDTENADVVQIDSPSTSNLGKKSASTTKLNNLPICVIYIDDDEEEEGPGKFFGDPANNQFAETSNIPSLFEDSDNDDCVMFVENGNVHCDHSVPKRNRYGLFLNPESSTSESTNLKSSFNEWDEFEGSFSDCEIMEDHSGNIREQWEKAAFKKESAPCTSDQATASSTTVYPEVPIQEPILQNADVGNCFENLQSYHFDEIFAEFYPRSPNYEQIPSVNIHFTDENIYFSLGDSVNIPVTPFSGPIPYQDPDNQMKDDEPNQNEYPKTAHLKDDGLSINKDAQDYVEDSFLNYQNKGKSLLSDKEEPSAKRRKTSCDSPTWHRKQVSKANFIFRERMEPKIDDFSYNTQSKDEIVAEQEVSSPLCSRQYEEPSIHAEVSTDCGKVDDNVNNKVELIETRDVGRTSYNESDTSHCYENFIGERERHKKTDQYKRVVEEEWASRQQQLQIQAEEAQKMRRRRKAERIRLLDMEKRQKQRLEEIRDLHKKDEETTQLKERILTEVRRDLERVEKNCTDMASVLRALGIHVKGGHVPMAHEIHAAYKQALLRFHPDRAPRNDIRKQVEAGEKFKLISRLKEKLLF